MITLKELEEIAANSPGMSMREWDELRKSCPEWVARKEQSDREVEERAARSLEVAQPMLIDLREAGYNVDNISYFVSTHERYLEAVPVLAKHLQRDYPYNIREGIIRALTVPEARGAPARAMLEQFRHSGNERDHVRWAMVNALGVIADAGMVEEMEALLADERDEAVARKLNVAIVKARKRKPIE
ncbi:hypothetical protein GRI68_06785 [Altererythrobacter halimionae]|uniref:HEAT repeat domain-containing protein n=1 Tax=Alteriqipengyuania halimionae TaxID=1926630 RepID=A0A6I4U608_9SPHN|nr:hypothetical protein [Alteriqipengyuania halimionae]